MLIYQQEQEEEWKFVLDQETFDIPAGSTVIWECKQVTFYKVIGSDSDILWQSTKRKGEGYCHEAGKLWVVQGRWRYKT